MESSTWLSSWVICNYLPALPLCSTFSSPELVSEFQRSKLSRKQQLFIIKELNMGPAFGLNVTTVCATSASTQRNDGIQKDKLPEEIQLYMSNEKRIIQLEKENKEIVERILTLEAQDGSLAIPD